MLYWYCGYKSRWKGKNQISGKTVLEYYLVMRKLTALCFLEPFSPSFLINSMRKRLGEQSCRFQDGSVLAPRASTVIVRILL
jgi:hypothetical protein